MNERHADLIDKLERGVLTANAAKMFDATLEPKAGAKAAMTGKESRWFCACAECLPVPTVWEKTVEPPDGVVHSLTPLKELPEMTVKADYAVVDEAAGMTKEQWLKVDQAVLDQSRKAFRKAMVAAADEMVADLPKPIELEAKRLLDRDLFTRWTDRARKVMVSAQQEARYWNHDGIGTEHLLVGLVKVGAGNGLDAIHRLGLPDNVILKAVRDQLQRGLGNKESVGVFDAKLPLTHNGRKIVIAANERARLLGVNHVGTEHVLLGISYAPDGVACKTLTALGATPERIEQEVMRMLGGKPELPEWVNPNWTKVEKTEPPEKYLGLYSRLEIGVDPAQGPVCGDKELEDVAGVNKRDKMYKVLKSYLDGTERYLHPMGVVTQPITQPLQVSRNTKALLFQVSEDSLVNVEEMNKNITSWLDKAGLGHVQVLITVGCKVMALEGNDPNIPLIKPTLQDHAPQMEKYVEEICKSLGIPKRVLQGEP